MHRYIAFLRGINLGKRRLPMSRLKSIIEELEYDDVETFIASGNVLFSTSKTDVQSLETDIATHLAASLEYDVDTFVRTTTEVAKIGRAKIFSAQDDEDSNVHVSFLHDKLPATTAKRLAAIRTESDSFRVVGREFYWLCRGRMSDSKVWTLPEMKLLKLPTSTMRSMTSIRKLIAKHIG